MVYYVLYLYYVLKMEERHFKKLTFCSTWSPICVMDCFFHYTTWMDFNSNFLLLHLYYLYIQIFSFICFCSFKLFVFHSHRWMVTFICHSIKWNKGTFTRHNIGKVATKGARIASKSKTQERVEGSGIECSTKLGHWSIC